MPKTSKLISRKIRVAAKSQIFHVVLRHIFQGNLLQYKVWPFLEDEGYEDCGIMIFSFFSILIFKYVPAYIQIRNSVLLEEITGKNDDFTPLQFLLTYCHPDFFIFLPKNFELVTNTTLGLQIIKLKNQSVFIKRPNTLCLVLFSSNSGF